MEREGSLPCSQEPATGPYPEPVQSNPYHPIPSYLSKNHQASILFLKISFGLPIDWVICFVSDLFNSSYKAEIKRVSRQWEKIHGCEFRILSEYL
jgi:hypothetical protein